ncbi:MAG: hypothetical protein MUE81_14010, partial [Thermoflexibacter sp.]|nr:hypothetical protein [Thermoflexibacter sp.]
PNLFPTTITPYTAPPIPPPVVVDAIATDATVCDKPNGTLVLTMDNVQEGQSYFIDIDGDGQADLNATAKNSQLIVNNIVGGTIILSRTPSAQQ